MKRWTGVAVLVLAAAVAGADEGMWMPSQLPELADQLISSGLELDPARADALTAMGFLEDRQYNNPIAASDYFERALRHRKENLQNGNSPT